MIFTIEIICKDTNILQIFNKKMQKPLSYLATTSLLVAVPFAVDTRTM